MKSIALFFSAVALMFSANYAAAADGPAPAGKQVHVVIAIGEDEYHAKETLPAFAKQELEQKLRYKVTVVQSDDKANMPGLTALKDADLLIMFLRRRTLPAEQLKAFTDYFDSGKPVVAIRTSCHSFQNWLEFDKVVLGCHYNNHYAKGGTMKIAPALGAASNALLAGVMPVEFETASTLYKVLPLAETCKPLLLGTIEGKPTEPVAWTNTYKGGRIFFTSLGAPNDFESPQFRQLLLNGIGWATEQPTTGK